MARKGGDVGVELEARHGLHAFGDGLAFCGRCEVQRDSGVFMGGAALGLC